jgi:transcriptional regulator with XRE-family HTH domain
LSQRAFAELVGTSGPTVAAYEAGAKEPRLSTLQRMADVLDWRAELRLVPARGGPAQRARRERRSRAIAAATAQAVGGDFARARRVADENLARMEAVVGDNRARAWLEEWRALLEQGSGAVQSMLLDDSPHGHDMRQMTPFAGLLGDEARQAALAASDALDLSDRAS